MPSIIDQVGSLISGIFNTIIAAFGSILAVFQSIFNAILGVIGTFFSALGTAVSGLAQTFEGLLKFLLSKFAQMTERCEVFGKKADFRNRQYRCDWWFGRCFLSLHAVSAAQWSIGHSGSGEE